MLSELLKTWFLPELASIIDDFATAAVYMCIDGQLYIRTEKGQLIQSTMDVCMQTSHRCYLNVNNDFVAGCCDACSYKNHAAYYKGPRRGGPLVPIPAIMNVQWNLQFFEHLGSAQVSFTFVDTNNLIRRNTSAHIERWLYKPNENETSYLDVCAIDEVSNLFYCIAYFPVCEVLVCSFRPFATTFFTTITICGCCKQNFILMFYCNCKLQLFSVEPRTHYVKVHTLNVKTKQWECKRLPIKVNNRASVSGVLCL